MLSAEPVFIVHLLFTLRMMVDRRLPTLPSTPHVMEPFHANTYFNRQYYPAFAGEKVPSTKDQLSHFKCTTVLHHLAHDSVLYS